MIRLALLAALLVCAGCGSHAALRPPPITEGFTELPCPKTPVSTVDLEACSEQEVTRGDGAIERETSAVFAVLHTPDAKRAFVDGEEAWLRYRTASCTAEASKFTGGTLEPVDYAGCLVGRNRAHLRELASTRDVLTKP